MSEEAIIYRSNGRARATSYNSTRGMLGGVCGYDGVVPQAHRGGFNVSSPSSLKLFASRIICALVIMCSTFTGCTCLRRDDDENIRWSFRRLHFVTGAIYQAALDEGVTQTNIFLPDALQWAVRKFGYHELLLYTNDASSIVQLDPQSDHWRFPGRFENEVCAYWPVKLTNQTGTRVFVGILFNGNGTNMVAPPKWLPISPAL